MDREQASHASSARTGRSRECQAKWADPRVSALGTAPVTAPFSYRPRAKTIGKQDHLGKKKPRDKCRGVFSLREERLS